jgi:hypothetical protein
MIDEQVIAVLDEADVRYFKQALTKKSCAQQAAAVAALPEDVPKPAAVNFFREALFALADATFLCEDFWREQARKHKIERDVDFKLDFHSKELSIMEDK